MGCIFGNMSSNWSPENLLLRALLREIRQESGLTQQEIAIKLVKPQSYMSKIESGERKLDLLEVREYCLACNVDFLKFIRRFEGKLTGAGY
jgi:transcriptional regulator with XRE-family HTH domain